MGCFDTVYIKCPECKKKTAIQTKAGECELRNYSYQQVPLAIAEELSGTKIKCECGTEFEITCPIAYVRLDLTLTGNCLY